MIATKTATAPKPNHSSPRALTAQGKRKTASMSKMSEREGEVVVAEVEAHPGAADGADAALVGVVLDTVLDLRLDADDGKEIGEEQHTQRDRHGEDEEDPDEAELTHDGPQYVKRIR